MHNTITAVGFGSIVFFSTIISGTSIIIFAELVIRFDFRDKLFSHCMSLIQTRRIEVCSTFVTLATGVFFFRKSCLDDEKYLNFCQHTAYGCFIFQIEFYPFRMMLERRISRPTATAVKMGLLLKSDNIVRSLSISV
jgi:hypothetical protein